MTQWVAASAATPAGITGTRFLTWLPVIFGATAALLTTPWLATWQTAIWTTFALWAGFKWLVWEQTARDLAIDSRRADVVKARRAFWLWPGMDPLPFLRRGESSDMAAHAAAKRRSWIVGGMNTLVGAAIAWGAARWIPDAWPIVKGWTFLVGLGLFVHCGLVHLMALGWQLRGVAARPIMHRPLAAESLADFWSRRWNTAFRDLAHRVVFKPISRRIGAKAAVFAVFLFSGIVHDAAISIPPRAGFGLPTAYFIIQWLAQGLQKSRLARQIGLAQGVGGRIFTAAVVIAPAGLLFHPPFIANVVLPLMYAVAAT